jgi:hypothetical protein
MNRKAPVVPALRYPLPGRLSQVAGDASPLDGEERNAARARYLRTRLREAGAHPN